MHVAYRNGHGSMLRQLTSDDGAAELRAEPLLYKQPQGTRPSGGDRGGLDDKVNGQSYVAAACRQTAAQTRQCRRAG